MLGALALFLPGFFSLPPTDRDESRFAQASRQMLEDGDYLHIRFQEQDRLNKPAGIYWLQAAAARLAGTGWANPIWPFRLPSLLGALAAVALTAGLGERLGSPGTGWRAGALLALTVLLGVEARLAKTDAVLLALVVAAQAALWAIYQAHRAHRPVSALAVQGFWLAQAAALLVKGPIALLVSLLTVLALALADRDARLWRALRPGWGRCGSPCWCCPGCGPSPARARARSGMTPWRAICSPRRRADRNRMARRPAPICC